MICSALPNYVVFENTSWAFDKITNLFDCTEKGLLELIGKVAQCALGILLILPSALCDLLFIAKNFIYPPVEENRELKPPESKLPIRVQKTLTTSHLLPKTQNEYMNCAVEMGLELIKEDQKAIYNDLIVNDGCPESGEPPLDIFIWLARCTIAYSLRFDQFFSPRLFPFKEVSLSEDEYALKNAQKNHASNVRSIQELSFNYRSLSEESKKIFIYLSIYKDPKIRADEQVKKMLKDFDKCAFNLNIDKVYNSKVLSPFLKSYKKEK